MIVYNTKAWFRLLFTYHGTVLPAVIPRLILTALWVAVVVQVDQWTRPYLRFPAMGHTLMGAVVGFLIVLRTNTAYERFWEGRKLWGGIVNSSRNLVREAAAFASHARELAELNIGYVLAVKQLLRGSRDLSEVAPWIPADDWNKVEGSTNPPVAISYLMGRWVQRRLSEGQLNAILAQHIDDRIRELIDHQGACERILKTPIPLNYAVHIKQFLTLYVVTLPFVVVGMFDGLGEGMCWLTIPAVLVIAFALGGVEEAGVEVEDPFGTDPNDLPLEAICATIERDVRRLAEIAESPAKGQE